MVASRALVTSRLTLRPLTVRARSRRLAVCAQADTGFRARWSLDVKFGSKADATALLQEWVASVGSAAGLTPDNCSLTTGSIGAPESTLELEVRFGSLAELEAFWSAIPQQQHRAWGQRMQQYIVHGSPQWHVYRCLPAWPEGAAAGAAGAGSSSSSGGGGGSSGGTRILGVVPSGLPLSSGRSGNWGGGGDGGDGGLLQLPSEEEVGRYAGDAPPPLPTTREQTASGLSVVSGDEEAQTVLDWKGDPMQIKPGDRLPFKLL